VAVGTAIAIVGAGVIVAVALPFTAPGAQRVSTADGLAAKSSWTAYFSTTDNAQASVTFSWNASSSADVRWYSAYTCDGGTGYCIQSGGPLKSWNGAVKGEWSNNGAPSTLYCVWVADNATAPLSFSGQFQELYHSSLVPLGVLGLGLTLTGGALLLGIGGVSIYLGLFLPGGTYGGVDPAMGDGDDPEFGGPDDLDDPR
jgi:hypothetical protein